MVSLNYVMFLIKCQIFKILLGTSSKKHETVPTNPPLHIYISKNYNRSLFRIQDGYKLELQTPETMKLFSSTKKSIGKTKNGGNSSFSK